MTVLAPDDLEDALAALAEDASLAVVAGGTDLMVAVNAGRRRPSDLVSLRRLEELRGWRREGGKLILGAGMTYTALLEPEVARLAPALAHASRTVGSPQIRNAGTIGGNLATASPAGDTLPVLAALDARIELASASGRRMVHLDELVVGPKQSSLGAGELIVAVHVPVAEGPQEYLKVGVRNAMVIAVASCALVVDRSRRRLACAFGSVGPVPVRDHRAESWLASEIDWDRGRANTASVGELFGRWMARVVSPIDDHRATAAYRRQATRVLARRAIERAFA